MDVSLVVETKLLAEDSTAIRDALWAIGRDSKADLGWLLEQGLDGFVLDEAEWNALEARSDDAAQARKQELKRRETQALLVSMRASTIAAETLMHDLGERVHELGAEMKAHQRKMWPLRRENADLEARLRELSGSSNGVVVTAGERHTLFDRLKEIIRRWRPLHE